MATRDVYQNTKVRLCCESSKLFLKTVRFYEFISVDLTGRTVELLMRNSCISPFQTFVLLCYENIQNVRSSQWKWPVASLIPHEYVDV
jgi:hypothetical protein